MNKEQFVKAMTFLAIAYNKEFTEEQIAIWYDFFKDDNYDNFKNAIKRIIVKQQFLPSVADLKKELAYIKTPNLQLKPDEEWENLKQTISKYGYYRADEAIKTLNPVTASVVRALGGWCTLCQSTDGDWLRKSFISIFNDKLNNTEEIAILSEPQMTLSELLRTAQQKQLEMVENEK